MILVFEQSLYCATTGIGFCVLLPTSTLFNHGPLTFTGCKAQAHNYIQSYTMPQHTTLL